MAPGPGVDGPGPGVLSAADYSGMMAASYESGMFGCGECIDEGFPGGQMPTVQVMMANPSGMHVFWDTTGTGGFDGVPLVAPGRTNFDQAGLYRCKITDIPGHEGVELYPTVEVGTPTPSTMAFLSHNAIPVQLTPDDFNQVTAGNFVTKVIYLPDPDHQHLAIAGVETLVSTRLDPGIDPVVEADRRGSILAIVRIGNKDIEMPGTEFHEYYAATLNEHGEVAQVGYDECLDGCSDAGCGCCGGGVGSGGGGRMAQRRAMRQAMGPGPMAQAMRSALQGPMPQGPMMAGENPTFTGMQGPTYGMPITGTPIGLPGPPHIPLGGPAGLKKHVMVNHTHQYVPDPSHDVKIHVKQHPPVRYPAPRTRAFIHQYNNPECAHCVGSGM